MPLSDIFGIASTALNAQRVRMNLTASNLANAGTSASNEGDAFRAKRPVFQALLDAAHLDAGSPYQGGVKVKKVVDDGAIIPRVFDPQHPLADKDGYTYESTRIHGMLLFDLDKNNTLGLRYTKSVADDYEEERTGWRLHYQHSY